MSTAPRRNDWLGVVFVLVAVVALAAAAYWWWQGRAVEPAVAPSVGIADAPADRPAPAAPEAPASVAHHPLAPASAPVQPERLEDALVALLGRDAVLRFLLTDDFPRRVVATVDNLGRAQATSRLWPVVPSPGRFEVNADTIGLDNGLRHAPFVQMVESVDPAHAVLLYRRLYPLLQQAYVELGYPNASFNDRLVQVIDQLLATPEPPGPIAVRLLVQNSPQPSPRPWVLYEFVDPALERLTAGQKMLLRLGPVNERRLKARLRALRAEIVAAAPR